MKNNQDKNFNDKKLTNLHCKSVNRHPSSDNELANKKYVDDSLGGGNILRFNQKLEFISKSPSETIHIILPNIKKIQLTDTTEIKIVKLEVIYYQNER